MSCGPDVLVRRLAGSLGGTVGESGPSCDECLNIHLFWSLNHAKVTIGDWKEECNHDRPHSSLGYRTPRAYAAIGNH